MLCLRQLYIESQPYRVVAKGFRKTAKNTAKMRFLERIWATLTVAVRWLTLSPVDAPGADQIPISAPLHLKQPGSGLPQTEHPVPFASGPVFKPPTAGPNTDFTCDYSNMPGWTPCSTADGRGCWLKNTVTGQQYNINIDYENDGPIGITRNYTIVINDGNVNADGIVFQEAKLFNNTYPGPWIQACWGDVSSGLSSRYPR